MKKIYYKVTVRLGKWIGKTESEDIYAKYLYNEGYIILAENHFVGFLTLDHLEGHFTDNKLTIMMLDFNNSKKLSLFSVVTKDFYLPGSFLLKLEGDENVICKLSFDEIVKDKEEQNEVEENYKHIWQLYNITD